MRAHEASHRHLFCIASEGEGDVRLYLSVPSKVRDYFESMMHRITYVPLAAI
jgi:hypothetical protein